MKITLKTFPVLVISLSFSILASIDPLTAAETTAFSVSYDQNITANGVPVAHFKIIFHNSNIRAEFLGENSVPAGIMFRNGSGYYNYNPQTKVAARVPQNMQQPNLTDDLPAYDAYLKRNNAILAGTETLDGRETDIYTFKDPLGHGDVKTWVWKEKMFPVKIEVTGPEGVTTVQFSNIQFDPPVTETDFELPADTKVMDFEAAIQETQTALLSEESGKKGGK